MVHSVINVKLLFFIIFIVVGIAALVWFIIALCKYRKKKTTGKIVALSILPLVLAGCIVGSVLLGIGRSAENKDIYIDLNQTISMNMDFELRSHFNINKLEVTFEFEDNNGTVVTKVVKKVGDVEAGKQYKISISLSEFGITDIPKIDKVIAEVTGGRVPYFG